MKKNPSYSLSLLCVLLAACAHGAQAAGEDLASSTYTHPNQRVAVEAARRLNLLCLGSGAPTVLFDAGAGFDIITWRHVQGRVAAFTRACAYDRAGYGFSDAAARAADLRNVVDDLHRLLRAAAIATPIVYVGHSVAGLYGAYLQKTHPEDVAAAVLIDPAFAGWRRALAEGLSPEERRQMDAPDWLAQDRKCLALAQTGALAQPVTDEQKACAFPAWYPERVDGTLRAEIQRRFSDPKVLRARIAEMASIFPGPSGSSADDEQLPGPVAFGDKPLVVLSRDQWYDGADMAPGKQAREFAAWIAGHDAVAAGSRLGSRVVVAHTGHFIQTDAPAAVVEAVKKAIEQVRHPPR